MPLEGMTYFSFLGLFKGVECWGDYIIKMAEHNQNNYSLKINIVASICLSNQGQTKLRLFCYIIDPDNSNTYDGDVKQPIDLNT